MKKNYIHEMLSKLRRSEICAIRGESHINYRMQCFILTLEVRGAIKNDVLKIRKVVEFQTSCIVIGFSYKSSMRKDHLSIKK